MSKADASYWVGFDLGGTKMLAAIFDAKFRVVARKRKKTKGHEGAESGVGRIAQTIRQVLAESEISPSQLAGIGVGCPGPVDLEKGVIHEAVNLGWRDVPVRKILRDEFGCPVAIANDVDVGVYGENRFGAAQGARTVIGVFPGTGIGGGCVYDGKILAGGAVSCMEIGHMRVTNQGRLCGCGRRGCLETEASRLAISAEVAKAAYRGQAPQIMKLAGTNLTDIRSGVLADAIKGGDKIVEQIVREAAERIGDAVASLVHLVAPDVVLLGGGLVEALPDLYVKTVSERARQEVMPTYAKTFRVVSAKLGDDAAVMGAAAWVERLSRPDETKEAR
jgi:glucokinase